MRMVTQDDLPAIMDYDFDAILPRADEMRRWVELGLDRVVTGVPGLVDTDEGLYGLIEDCRAAGVEVTPAIVSS